MHITEEDSGLTIKDDRFTLHITQWDGLTKKLAREACTWLDPIIQELHQQQSPITQPLTPPQPQPLNAPLAPPLTQTLSSPLASPLTPPITTPLNAPVPPQPSIQIPPISNQPVPQTPLTPESNEDIDDLVIRNPKGQFSGLFTDNVQYKRDSRIPLYKPIVDYLFENTSNVFTHKQVAGLIADYWEKVLNRKISNNSKKTYSSSYIHLMKEIGWVRSYNGKRGVCKKVGRNNDPATVAKEIWAVAADKNWTNNHRPVPLEMIQMSLLKYTEEEIKFGLARLVDANSVTQLASDKVMFNTQP